MMVSVGGVKVLLRLRLLHACATESLDLQGVIRIAPQSFHVLFPLDRDQVLKLEILELTPRPRKLATLLVL